ncbi:gp436 family protein [Aeromonas sp. QDB51]|uniref:gp436 family protein n=1 Tax=Aeromonas sp. QDB51 TaxID=2989827 RepID=UPI0022E66E3F|nr:phage protein Gp36 family protein [Aeromonas sp. QDB51]
MSYASVSDMVTRFGEAELLRLAMTPAGELDDAAITVALQDASALIDGYLAGRYPLPLAHVQIAKRYEAALAFLKSVGKGELALGLAADGEQVESQNLAQLQSDGRIFGRGTGGFL